MATNSSILCYELRYDMLGHGRRDNFGSEKILQVNEYILTGISM